MNDYWLLVQAQERAQEIRREMANIHLAQAVGHRKPAFHFRNLLGTWKQRSPQKEKGDSHDSAGRAILAVD